VSFLPRFTYTNKMVNALGVIEGARAVIDVLPLPPDQALFLRQAARQRATKNSTAIEGNTLNSVEVAKAVVSVSRSRTEMQQEARNYWRALEWIEEQTDAKRPITEQYIQELHSIIYVRGHGRRGLRSEYRPGECPVVDSNGRIDYGPPEPKDVPLLMKQLVEWLNTAEAKVLPGPVRAGLLAHRFVSVHPFGDGNGRTARALATSELWRSGYDMRGFLSLEENYMADLHAYYDSLQMGLPVNYYEGRHDPDHTVWLEFFLGTMASAADALRRRAVQLHGPDRRPAPPWERLRRIQQQVLTRLLTRMLSDPAASPEFTPPDVVEWYGVSANTAREWLDKWREEGFVHPAKKDVQRVRRYKLGDEWVALIRRAVNATRKTS
jgi:Fic family protein